MPDPVIEFEPLVVELDPLELDLDQLLPSVLDQIAADAQANFDAISEYLEQEDHVRFRDIGAGERRPGAPRRAAKPR